MMNITSSTLLIRVALVAAVLLVLHTLFYVFSPEESFSYLREIKNSHILANPNKNWSFYGSNDIHNKHDDINRVYNDTLGFEKVFVISLPERTDKRDAITLMCAVSNITFEWSDGVKMDEMVSKAIPYGIHMENVHDNFVSNWRTHMNAVHQIVRSGVSSALILEDDVDWDVHLKSQLHHVALGAQHILPSMNTNGLTLAPQSPYGDEWDVLWLGHCGDPLPETVPEHVGLDDDTKALFSKKYLIYDDDTVPGSERVSNGIDWSQYPPQTRIVHRTTYPFCTFAYALSQRGARKILSALSLDGVTMAFDNSLGFLCGDTIYEIGHGKEERYGLNCLSVSPTMMFHHRAKGPLSADSDVQKTGSDGAIREKGFTECVKYSTRLNLMNLLDGRPIENQFDTMEAQA